MLRRLVIAAVLSVPALALGQADPGSTAPQATGQVPVHQDTAPAAAAAAPEGSDVKHDQGTVRTVDAQRGTVIADLPDGPVTYDVSQAQLLDAEGKPAGVATQGLKTGDRIRITYKVDVSCEHAPACKGAIASEVRLMK